MSGKRSEHSNSVQGAGNQWSQTIVQDGQPIGYITNKQRETSDGRRGWFGHKHRQLSDVFVAHDMNGGVIGEGMDYGDVVQTILIQYGGDGEYYIVNHDAGNMGNTDWSADNAGEIVDPLDYMDW